ncbi:GOLPH3/VPS74 family protein [Nocardioides coralli]|uniref:GOLPH3/VPS74 family protein n=1 Tax=Nocardioides coralli TaxID=2872154 RepID=UPI001CA38F39|nr:GPP34 family phosphoprotein [Nocardioides coralli]QZY28295.1 GPP34 family phosphoprotein [Nocardioides coralli]
MEMLIAEDLLLLLLDDDKGTVVAGTADRPLVGGALLAELALARLVTVTEKQSAWSSSHVVATGGPGPDDPVLDQALSTVMEKARSANDLVDRLGKDAREQLLARLVERGILERRDRKVLGVFPRTTWPAADVAHEESVRQRLQQILVTGLVADQRSAALIALLVAVDRAHAVVDRGDLSAREVRKRAQRVADGEWASQAVRDAVQASQAAVAAAVIAASTAVTAGGS